MIWSVLISVILNLDRADKAALEDIRRIQRAGNFLENAIPNGVLAAIFLGNNIVQVAYNIYTTDWVLFARSMKTLPDIVRVKISQIAKLRILSGVLNYEQRQFWNAVDQGCEIF